MTAVVIFLYGRYTTFTMISLLVGVTLDAATFVVSVYHSSCVGDAFAVNAPLAGLHAPFVTVPVIASVVLFLVNVMSSETDSNSFSPPILFL